MDGSDTPSIGNKRGRDGSLLSRSIVSAKDPLSSTGAAIDVKIEITRDDVMDNTAMGAIEGSEVVTTTPPLPADPPTAAEMKIVKNFLEHTTARATAAMKSGIVVPNVSFGDRLLVPVAKQLARFFLGLINMRHPIFCNGGSFKWPSVRPMPVTLTSPGVPIALGTAAKESPEFMAYMTAKATDIMLEGFRPYVLFQRDILDPAARDLARMFLGLINPEFTWP